MFFVFASALLTVDSAQRNKKVFKYCVILSLRNLQMVPR